MKRNVVACLCSIAAVTLMAGCQQTPDAAKTLDPSGLRIFGDAYTSNTNEKDVPWGPIGDTNPCNGDFLTITGTSHRVLHFGFDSQGGFHSTQNVISRGTGVGSPSGKQYTIFDQDHFSEQAPANSGGFVIMDRLTMRVSGPTRADDYTTMFQDKTTLNSHADSATTTIIKDTGNTCS